ncbi:MAG TPA: SIMPL domain-containing protein [Bdellovibrionota bacterium]|jgi:hypothetical protein
MTKISVLILALLFPLPALCAPERIVSVQGEGEVKIKPDLAHLYLNVQSKAKDAKTAQDKAAKEMKRLQNVLTDSFKIEEKDIQTMNYDLQPDYRYEQASGKQILTGFRVTHGLNVKVRKLDKVGDLLDKVSSPGSAELSVSVNSIQFDTDKRKAYEVQALESAMSNAKERAEALAKFSNRRLKGVITVSDGQMQSPPVFFRGRMEKAMMADSAAASGTSVQAGEIEIKTTVRVEFEMD